MSFTVSKNGRLALLNVATQVSSLLLPHISQFTFLSFELQLVATAAVMVSIDFEMCVSINDVHF